jgi:hypothetical protein
MIATSYKKYVTIKNALHSKEADALSDAVLKKAVCCCESEALTPESPLLWPRVPSWRYSAIRSQRRYDGPELLSEP